MGRRGGCCLYILVGVVFLGVGGQRGRSLGRRIEGIVKQIMGSLVDSMLGGFVKRRKKTVIVEKEL